MQGTSAWRRRSSTTPPPARPLLVGWLCLAAIFLWSGPGKIGGFEGFAGMLANQGLPASTLAALVAIVVESGGAALVVLGLFTRPAAAGLILFTVAATLLAHDFWTLEGSERQMQQIQFMKNLGLIGGFLVLIAAGSAAFRLTRAAAAIEGGCSGRGLLGRNVGQLMSRRWT